MSSHRQIFKSTALIGGMQVINMSVGIVRLAPGALPIAEELASTVLSLPVGPHLAPNSASFVAQLIFGVLCEETHFH